MPNMIRRMTGAVAERFMLENRGYVCSGCCADLTVFDEDKLKAAAPDRVKPFGIERVFIYGQPVLARDALNAQALSSSGKAVPVK